MNPDHKSQHGIESYIEKYLPGPGFFVEIGAWDGEIISQTIRLEQDKGWKGICVDPFPHGFSNRDCDVVWRAISKDGKDREFLQVSIDRRNGGDVSYFSGFADSMGANLELIYDHCDYNRVTVKTVTIDNLWERYKLPNYVDFLSIDTEGSELEIFQSIDFNKLSFGLIVFEHNENINVKHNIGRLLNYAGYKLLDKLRCDDIYINSNI